MKQFIIGTMGVLVPIVSFTIGMYVNYSNDTPQNDMIYGLREKVKVLEEESNDRFATIIQLTDAVNILSNHYNNTSGNKMVPVVIDGDTRVILK
jgi:hypothetical protein